MTAACARIDQARSPPAFHGAFAAMKKRLAGAIERRYGTALDLSIDIPNLPALPATLCVKGSLNKLKQYSTVWRADFGAFVEGRPFRLA